MRLEPIIPLVASCWLFCFANPAHADGGTTPGKITAALGLRYGSDNLDLGLGVRGGYTLESGFYVGGDFDYFFGKSVDISLGLVDYSFWALLPEAGYDFEVAPRLILRPVVTLGVVGVAADCPEVVGAVSCEDDAGLEGGLGALTFYAIGPVTLGGELRLLFGNWDAFVVGLNAGVLF